VSLGLLLRPDTFLSICLYAVFILAVLSVTSLVFLRRTYDLGLAILITEPGNDF
jgi:hypothetical protein